MSEPASARAWMEQALAEQRRRWSDGDRTPVESYLRAGPNLDADAALDLIYQEVVLRESAGEKPTLEEYLKRFPAYERELRRQFDLHKILAEEATLVESSPHPGAEPSAPPTPLRRFLVGGYEIEQELSRNSRTAVYRGYDPWLRRHVALRLILPGNHAPPDVCRLFLAEARSIAQFQHSNFVQILAAGEEGNMPFLVMELVEGPTLATRIAHALLDPTEAARLVTILARALQAAHERGIAHCQLRPTNILLHAEKEESDQMGAPKIGDLGTARLFRAGSDAAGDDQEAVGHEAYLSPEQAVGHVAQVGPQSDVYSLGAILYECLTGQPPFQASMRAELMRMVGQIEPVPPRRLNAALPHDLETICLRCLQKQPGRRYPSAAALADDLDRFLEQRPIVARPARAARWPTVLLACALVAVAIGVIAYFSLR